MMSMMAVMSSSFACLEWILPAPLLPQARDSEKAKEQRREHGG
jgi:hypothetical protein